MKPSLVHYRKKYPWWLVKISILIILLCPCMLSRTPNVDALTQNIKERLTPVKSSRLPQDYGGQKPALINAIIRVESSGRSYVSSSKGAIGLMQVMPSTAKFLGLPHSRTELLDPNINRYVGIRILNYYHKKAHGDLWQALIWYSGGDHDYPARVMKEYIKEG